MRTFLTPLTRRIGTYVAGLLAGVLSTVTPDQEAALAVAVSSLLLVGADLGMSALNSKVRR